MTAIFKKKNIVFYFIRTPHTNKKKSNTMATVDAQSLTPDQIAAAMTAASTTGTTAAPMPLLTINHSVDYAKLRNLLLIVIAVSFGAKLLLMLIEFMLDKK